MLDKGQKGLEMGMAVYFRLYRQDGMENGKKVRNMDVEL